MNDRIFVDTNVLVYAHDKSAGTKHRVAKKLIIKLWESNSGCLSVQVLQEFYVSVTQKVPQPMEVAVAAQVIRNLSYWKVHEPSKEDVLSAIAVSYTHLRAHET